MPVRGMTRAALAFAAMLLAACASAPPAPATPQIPIEVLKPGDVITVASRRGEITLTARADEGTPRSTIFIPFAFYEAAANLLTNAALDPFGKIAELKYCAVKLSKGGKLQPLATYGGGQSFSRDPAPA